MRGSIDPQAVAAVRAAAIPLRGTATDHDALLELVGDDTRFVLLGEASHGTHDFYQERAAITRRLIVEKGFDAVAIEGDWPDAYRVNRYVRGANDDVSAADALAGFRRFPSWMWRNPVVAEFVAWLRQHNDAQRSAESKAGFYGIDLYSLNSSMEAVLGYLDRTQPEAARRARERYSCFEHFGEDSQTYGFMTRLGTSKTCEEEVITQLLELQRQASRTARRSGDEGDTEDAFQAEQNARLVKNAEAYYRSMYLSDVSSWNLRDDHMAETLDELARHLGRRGRAAKIVVWAHNSHLGDARATEMGERGEINLGQRMRERHGSQALLVGFTTHTGSVTAASDWDSPAERKTVLPSRDDSVEGLLHATGIERFFLPLKGGGAAAEALRKRRLERAIGVIYRPQTERQSHYFHARLSDQFDAVYHFDTTRALTPLDAEPRWRVSEVPETFPSGL